MMAERDQLLQSIADIIADYRTGQIAEPDATHVDRWINQFDKPVQLPILMEMEHVLERTYLSRKIVKKFLNGLVKNQKLAGNDPCSFWREVNFLKIQQRGESQKDFLKIFEKALIRECGLKLSDCGKAHKTFLYIDDALFSGGHIKSDIINWISKSAPSGAKVIVVTIAMHRLGLFLTKSDLTTAGASKNISFEWKAAFPVEDRKGGQNYYLNQSDVLRPTAIPDDGLTRQYIAGLSTKPDLRTPGNTGSNGFFSSEAGKHLLEQEFLKAGVRIRQMCPHLNEYQRPLGNTLHKKLGFGSMLVTFRNCPNNAPLVLWAGNPWYPLFARSTN
jgi:hypothetical protein